MVQERRRGECEQLPPDLLITCVVQTILNNSVRKNYTQCLTKNKLKIRLASENPTRQRITLLRTDWLNRKCHEWRIKMWTATATSRRHSTPSLTILFGRHSNLATSITSTSASWGRCTKTRRLRYRDEESKIFDIQKGSKQWDPMSGLLFNTVLQYSLKEEIQCWQKKKGMGIYLSDHDRDCLTNLRFADDVMLFATSKEQIRKMLCDFKKATEKVGLRIHRDKTKILSNQSTINSDTQQHIEVGDMSIEILTIIESVKYLCQRISFCQQETIEIKSWIRAAWATFHKYRRELTSKNYMLKHRRRLFDATVSPIICYAAGTWAPNKEHARIIQSTQRKMLRLIIQTERKYKKIEKQNFKCVAPMTKVEMIRAQRLTMTWTVMWHLKAIWWGNGWNNDWRGRMDRLRKEKHYWCFGKDGTCKDSMLEQDPQKNEMEIGTENCNFMEEKMAEKSCWMVPWSKFKIWNWQSDRKTEKDGKMTSMISSNKLMKKNENLIERSNQTNKNWINIAKDWRRWALLERDYTMTVS